jgi:hypothetical protein
VDGAVILITTPRRVGFLVAEKSMQKLLIGDFARACGSIPGNLLVATVNYCCTLDR